MHNLLLIFKLLTETKSQKLYLFGLLAVGLLSSIAEIFIFLVLQSNQHVLSFFNNSKTFSVSFFVLLFSLTKPAILQLGAKYSGVLENRLYLDSCFHSLSLHSPDDSGNDSQIITESLINPLRISNTVFIPLVYAIPAALSGIVLTAFLAAIFPGYFVLIAVLGISYFLGLSKFIDFRLRSLSRSTYNATIKAKALLTFFNTDKFNLNFHGSIHMYMNEFAKTISRISHATSGQLFYNNFSKVIFDVLGVYFIAYAGIDSGFNNVENATSGLGLGILLFVLTRLASIANQMYGVKLSLSTNFSQLLNYFQLRNNSRASLIDNIDLPRPSIDAKQSVEKYSSIRVVNEVSKKFRIAGDFTTKLSYETFDDLVLEKGKITVVTGDSGAGKSTLIRQILYARFEFFDQNVSLFKLIDENKGYEDPTFCLGSRIYILTQSCKVMGLTLDDLIALKKPDLNLFYQDLGCLFGDQRARELLKTKDNLTLDKLSGGEQQRLFLAFASGATQPVVIVDESLDGLDRAAKIRTIQLLISRGKSILMVTHNSSMPFLVAHRYVLSKNTDNERSFNKIISSQERS